MLKMEACLVLNIKEGGYSELLKTNVRNLIKIPNTLTPKDVAPFSDAGLTAYRVVKKATRHLLPGETCSNYRSWWFRTYRYSMFKSNVCC